MIGNDVVDLSDSRCWQKSKDSRFLNRVFSARERALICESTTPDQTLWILWSGKEAAYKALKRVIPKLVFAHSRFEVYPNDGVVRYADFELRTTWQVDETFVHAVATLGEHRYLSRVTSKADVETRAENKQWTEAEMAVVHSSESLLVRCLAKELLSDAGLQNGLILNKPPEYRPLGQNTARSDVTISLSHDGDWVAAAVALSDERVPSPSLFRI